MIFRSRDVHLLNVADLSIEAAVEAGCRIVEAALARSREARWPAPLVITVRVLTATPLTGEQNA